MGRFLHHLWWIPWMNSVLSPSQVVQDFLHQFISWRIVKVCPMFSYTEYIYIYHIYIYGSMFILYTYVLIIYIYTSTLQSKYTLANGNPPFSKHGKGKHIYLPSTWGDGVEPLRFRESTSLSEKEKIRARLFSILCDCEVALWAHISYVIA